ncbi:Aste57867_3572 [Aphanomyces stellatus]|uniref:Aste57867_3572 protein n=1 Tax=Aphanomyces stellatus TaxID=120398 RepID=A0A485K9Z5_9STRA|nr:hypothetical protein As57867_003561 [Aphanomyces stellatus]VFT80734.1 Aste57867_3572 [Aphanomyces stellatus]
MQQQQAGADRLDLQERLSYIHSATAAKEGDDGADGAFNEVKTPGELEDGALVEGGALPLFSREAFALYAQYAAIGVIYGMLPGLNYPIFNVYLNMEGYQTASYGVLVNLGWSYKVFFGMLSDCFPIMGYRRKAWMLIGWSVAFACLAVMAFSDLGDPFCDRANEKYAKYCGKPLEKVPQAAKDAAFNLEAPDVGAKFIMLSMFTSFGYVTAACASDAMVVQYAQREPAAIRGRVQTAIYTVRTIFSMVASAIIAFGLNGANYNGSFSVAMGPNVPYMICLFPCVLVMLTTIFVLVEVKKPAIPIGVWWIGFWELLQKRVMWQICAFRFINNVFNGIGATAGSPIQTYWAEVETLNDSLSGVIGKAIFAVILAAVGKWGLHWNWRWIIALGSIGVILVDGFVMFMTIWDVVRNQWFFTGVGLADNIPDGVRFIVGTYCAVEVADPGNEGATYGLITTMNNLASPMASILYKFIDSYFLVTNNDIKTDTHEVRMDATYVYVISYCSKLFALVWLFMLPPQRAQVQELKKKGGKSKLAGVILVVLFFGVLSVAMTSNFMSIYPSTKCYRIAGGNGKLDTRTGKCPRPAPRK